MDIDAIQGTILGTAVGDAVGLPCEGLSGTRIKKMFPDLSAHHFLLGRGMVSDDTEHTCFVAQGIINSDGDPKLFGKHLARALRLWLLGIPAGVGFATLRSIFKLWLGISPQKSGVFSAGNGPAMRSALLGVVYGKDFERLKEFVESSTKITHSDPKAFNGAYIVALAAFHSAGKQGVSPAAFAETVKATLRDRTAGEINDLIRKAAESAERKEDVIGFAKSLGSRNGISGYIYHTVPCVVQTWLRYQNDFEQGVKEIILAGGDTDTTAAILGGIIGARTGIKGIPEKWVDGIIEWPRSIPWMIELGKEVFRSVNNEDGRAPGYFIPGLIPRNMVFLLTVLFHGIRRILPPY